MAVDYAWPPEKVALEIEGGVWKRGRHNRPRARSRLREVQTQPPQGWYLIRCLPEQLESASRGVVAKALAARMTEETK